MARSAPAWPASGSHRRSPSCSTPSPTTWLAVAPDASLYVFGSVATGQARSPTSDVDLLAIGLDRADAASLTMTSTERFVTVCRGVDVGAAAEIDLEGEHDEAYGFRVFLHHYCVHLAGPDRDRSGGPYLADVRAARGFNGDIARHLHRWLGQVDEVDPAELGRRIARKSLLAAAGLVSVHDSIWTTDRSIAAARLGRIDPSSAPALDRMLAVATDDVVTDHADVVAMLDGVVATIVERFADEIGVWGD